MHPGRDGTKTVYPPSSAGSKMMRKRMRRLLSCNNVQSGGDRSSRRRFFVALSKRFIEILQQLEGVVRAGFLPFFKYREREILLTLRTAGSEITRISSASFPDFRGGLGRTSLKSERDRLATVKSLYGHNGGLNEDVLRDNIVIAPGYPEYGA